MADENEVDDLLARFGSHRESLEEKLLQEPDADDLRDMLEEVEDAIALLEAEDGQAPLADLSALEARVAERLQK